MVLDDLFYKLLLDETFDGIYCQNLDGRIFYWNTGAYNITGYSDIEAMGRDCSGNIFRKYDENGRAVCDSRNCDPGLSVEKMCALEGEFYVKTKDGRMIPIILKTKPLFDEFGEINGVFGIFHDNTARGIIKNRLEKLEKESMIDFLTGLGNRRYGEMHLQLALDTYYRKGTEFGVVFFDIDHFKEFNDKYGHKKGDNTLMMIGLVMRHIMRSNDIVCRWGGEEFVVIAHETEEQSYLTISEKIRNNISENDIFGKDAEKLRVTVSIGFTKVMNNDTIQSIVDRADHAMYESKKLGRNRVTGSFQPLLE